MTLSTYSELENTVSRYLDRTDRATEIQDWVRLVELEVGRKLNLRSQQMRTTGTLAGGSDILETPAGILYPQQLVFNTQPPVVVSILALPQLEETAFAASGFHTPYTASIWGVNSSYQTQIRLAPTPPEDVPYTLYYTTGITELTPSSPVNYLLTVAADLYLYGCMYHGHMFDENPEGAAVWRPGYDDAIEQLRRIEGKARARGGRLRVRPQHATP